MKSHSFPEGKSKMQNWSPQGHQCDFSQAWHCNLGASCWASPCHFLFLEASPCQLLPRPLTPPCKPEGFSWLSGRGPAARPSGLGQPLPVLWVVLAILLHLYPQANAEKRGRCLFPLMPCWAEGERQMLNLARYLLHRYGLCISDS